MHDFLEKKLVHMIFWFKGTFDIPRIKWGKEVGSITLHLTTWVCICGLWNIMKLSSSCKRKTKQRTYLSQLAYKHHCKLFGCWNLGIMEHFLWMEPLVPMCKGTIFSPWWCLTIIVKVYRSSMGNHKLANKIGLNTMVTSIERTHLERGSHFMFHCKWCPSRVWCNQYNTQFTYLIPFCFM